MNNEDKIQQTVLCLGVRRFSNAMVNMFALVAP